ncbi:CubicO group peptidase (beta-lactamase class C family) [Inquilinus ginsengisoli]|uniref:serine hydrolase n=1 Tax=Inquilinus ginsengisoli TaxID=363840 RepID=UPI003D1FC888
MVARVTLRQLLSHSAGTSVRGFPGYPAAGPWPSVTEVLDGALPANTPPVVVEGLPGVAFRYSGGGTTIAQQVVTDVLKRPFPEAMRELVLDPSGMRHSTYDQPLLPAEAARAASGHSWNSEPVPGGWHVYPEMAAAGLWTTAGDLARLGAELMRILQGRGSALGLRRETVAAMLRPQLTHQEVGRNFVGIGWFCDGQGEAFQFGHRGDDEGFLANMQVYPERCAAVVVMINSMQGWPLLDEIPAALGRAFGWTDRPDAAAEVPASEVKEYLGSYRHPGGATIRVALAGDGFGLALRFGSQAPVPLVRHARDAFTSPTTDLRASFDRDANRRCRALILTQFGTELRFDRHR